MNAPPPPPPTAAQIRRALADETNKQPKKKAGANRKVHTEALSEDEASLYFILKNGRASIQVQLDFQWNLAILMYIFLVVIQFFIL